MRCRESHAALTARPAARKCAAKPYQLDVARQHIRHRAVISSKQLVSQPRRRRRRAIRDNAMLVACAAVIGIIMAASRINADPPKLVLAATACSRGAPSAALRALKTAAWHLQ